MYEIETEITEIENKYYDEAWDYTHPYREDEEGEHGLFGEIYDYLEEKRKVKQIKEYSVKDIDVVNSCGRNAGVYSIVCIGNNDELYHRLIEWDIL